ncbi:MAG: glycosyltransferase [Bdellovibrionales bacterium]
MQKVWKYMNALDVYCSTSTAEAFSNSIGEAMSCGVPVIATDVGDSASIVDKTGLIIASNDLDGLSQGLSNLWKGTEWRNDLSQRARQRVVEEYELNQVLNRYLQTFCKIMGS